MAGRWCSSPRRRSSSGIAPATPNDAEAARFAPGIVGDGLGAVAERGRTLLRRWSAVTVAVTVGPRGAVLVTGDGPPLVAPAPAALNSDPCGAGDRFASWAAGMLADGALPSEAVSGAVMAASTFVADGRAAAGQPGRCLL